MGLFKSYGGTSTTNTSEQNFFSKSSGGESTESAENESQLENGSVYDAQRKSIGITSAIFLIFNRMIGTGIFATPSQIFNLTGSVGLSLMMWVAGSLIAASGLMVYLEWGSAIPKNGGEKNYLEYYFKKPKFLATSMYASYVFFIGWAASNSVVFGEYILYAAGKEVDRWNQRVIGLACVTFSFLIHAFALKWGLRLQNLLGMFKLVVIALIIVTGWAALGGGISRVEPTHAFSNAFEGSKGSGYGIVMSLYNVIWSFVGYSNANYALSEAKNPNRILKIAAPVALVSVAIMYVLCNISYFAVVPLDVIKSSGRILAAEFFGRAFGKKGETALAVFVALSAMGNVLSVIFSQGRIVQELAREGVLPLSRFLSSNKPLNAPAAGLFQHWIVSVVIMLAPPPGDAYNFILNLISYPLSIVNASIAFALLGIYFTKKTHFPDWDPPIKATLPVTLFFFLSSIYLIAAPFVPPDTPEQSIYESIPYYLHCVVGIALFIFGGLYWALWAKLLPRLGGYTLDSITLVDANGWSRQQIIKRYQDGTEVAVRY